jgi:hypothetical protein
MNHQDNDPDSSRLESGQQIATCNKNPFLLAPRAPGLLEGDDAICNRAIVPGPEFIYEKSMPSNMSKHNVFHILFAAFRHIPCQRQKVRPATKLTWFQITGITRDLLLHVIA